MRGAAAAVAMCCLIHAGLASALLGWSVGSWPGALVAAAVALVLARVLRHRHAGHVTDDTSQRESVGPGPAR